MTSRCSHVDAIVNDKCLQNYSSILQFHLQRRYPQAYTNPTTVVPACSVCQRIDGKYFYCLECVFAGCKKNRHSEKHAKEKSHPIGRERCLLYHSGVDSVSLDIVCVLCNQYSFVPEMDELKRNEERKLKNRLRDYAIMPLEVPNGYEILPCSGLRGLYNLGNTCFMNSILQATIHNPLLKKFFLSGSHAQKCVKPSCLACDMDDLFSQCHSGHIAPFSAHRILYSIWKQSRELAGYDQQDAHEFFICLMNGIHSSLDKKIVNDDKKMLHDCGCVIHSTFTGVLQSNVRCLSCGNSNSVSDPFFDISLDLRKDGQIMSLDDRGFERVHSLLDCLKRYTSEEKLGNSYNCPNCMIPQPSVKQLSFKSLPPVLCLHLKRFEHNTTSSKIDVNIRFPLEFSMTPFTTEYLGRNGTHSVNLRYHYRIFALISHIGSMDTGHYISYIKFKEDWYKMDDANVTLTSLKEVMGISAYMLFYSRVC